MVKAVFVLLAVVCGLLAYPGEIGGHLLVRPQVVFVGGPVATGKAPVLSPVVMGTENTWFYYVLWAVFWVALFWIFYKISQHMEEDLR